MINTLHLHLKSRLSKYLILIKSNEKIVDVDDLISNFYVASLKLFRKFFTQKNW